MANRLGLPNSNNFVRPVSPHGHIYMEIDPIYARLGPPPTAGDHGNVGGGDRYSGDSTESSVGSEDQQPASDLSDDDTVQQQLQQRLQQRHPSDILVNCTSPSSAEASRQSSSASQAARFAEDRPLIRNNTLRRSAPLRSYHNNAPAVSTLGGIICHSNACAAGRSGGGSVRAATGRRQQRDNTSLDPRHFETPITIALGGGGAGLTRNNGGGGGLTRGGSGMTHNGGVSREDLWLADGGTNQQWTAAQHRRAGLGGQQFPHFPATHGYRP
jgi:hypothetical protein